MTPFCFEHVFVADSVAEVFAAYFDDDQQAEQDHVLEITSRETLERTPLSRVCRVTPRRQLPALVRPFVTAPLQYIEVVNWQRERDELAITIRPNLGRVEISATYRLEQVAPQSIRRRYAGCVSVDIALIGARIERGFVEELGRSLPRAAGCTQAWLDRIPRSMAARA
jgi:Protein of unknown function (DUF2505)